MPGLIAFTRFAFFKVECPVGQTIGSFSRAIHAEGWSANGSSS